MLFRSDAAYLKCNVTPSLKKKDPICIVKEDRWKDLYPLYCRFAEKYSGIVKRTEADFLRKAADYAADGGKSIAYIDHEAIKAYAFYYQTDAEITCVEAVADDGYWEKLMESLFALGSGLKFSAKLPPDVEISSPFASLEKLQKGVMGLCNAASLLKILDLTIPYGFKLRDHVISEHNTTLNFHGDPYHGEPVFEISAGHLLQVLVGYHSLHELKSEIVIYDAAKFDEIDSLLPKQNCYIIDEY